MISKLEAAKRNLRMAIRLFFEQGDAVAVHTLGASAQAIVRDIARARGLEHASILHDHPDVPAHLRREWIAKLNAARNFFKHADQDPEGILEFDESQNELVLLDAVLVLSQLDSDGLEEANVFVGWITTGHPELRPAVSNNVIGDYCARNNVLASDFERFRELCDERILVDRPR